MTKKKAGGARFHMTNRPVGDPPHGVAYLPGEFIDLLIYDGVY
jgi:hypothetical protein